MSLSNHCQVHCKMCKWQLFSCLVISLVISILQLSVYFYYTFLILIYKQWDPGEGWTWLQTPPSLCQLKTLVDKGQLSGAVRSPRLSLKWIVKFLPPYFFLQKDHAHNLDYNDIWFLSIVVYSIVATIYFAIQVQYWIQVFINQLTWSRGRQSPNSMLTIPGYTRGRHVRQEFKPLECRERPVQ